MTAIETLNHWGACFTDFAPRILAQSSLLMIILFALDLALRKKVRAAFRYGLWLLVLVKLILPPSFASPTSLAYWLPNGKSPASDRLIPLPGAVRQSEIRIDSPAPSAAKALPLAGPRLSWPALILIGWAIGAVGLFWFLIHRSRYVARQVKAATDASDDLIALLKQCGAQMRLSRALRLKLARSPMSPAVCGFGRPVILISRRLAERLSVSQLRAVLLHEMAHVKRSDIWVNHAQTLLQIFYWWHPLLWLANAHIRRVREQAVDEQVMVQMGEEGGSYAATLIEVARIAVRPPLPALGLIGIVESRSALAQRIQHLLDRPAPQSAKSSLASLAAILITGALLVPMAQGQRREGNRRAGQPSGLEAGNGLNPPQSIAEVDSESNVLDTRTYKLDLYVLRRNLQKLSDDPFFGDSSLSLSDLVCKFLEAHDVTFQAPKTIFLNERTGALLVRTTAEELEIVRSVVIAMNTGKVPEDLGFLPPVNEAVAVKPTQADPGAALVSRTFRLNSSAFLEALQRQTGPLRVAGTTNSAAESLRDFLAAAGVSMTPPNLVFFSLGTGMLLIRAPAEEIDLAQKAIEVLNVAPPQITLEARFMELPTDAARKLGFDLPPPGESSNTWERVLTAAQMRTVLHAAEQRDGVDILAAPKVTTLAGRQAQIQAVELKTIVAGINPEALTPPGVRSTNGVPAQPYVTSQLPVGPTLETIPYVAADGYTIHLTALPQVTELLPYDTTVNAAKDTSVWVNGEKRKVPMPLPIIRTRSMQATADVYNGQALVIANPQVTVSSKQLTGESVTNAVPEDAAKRLLVFITPTIIDPAGNPIHTPGNEPFPSDEVPHQPSYEKH